MKRFSLSLALLVFVSTSAHAAIIDVQGRIDADKKDGWRTLLTFSGNKRTGNTDLLDMSGVARIQYRQQGHLVYTLLNGTYGLKGEEVYVSKVFEHLRYRYTVGELWDVESFAQHEFDEFRRLSLRAIGGFGPRLTLFDGPIAQVALGSAYMFEYEKLTGGTTEDAGESTIKHRSSNYLRAEFDITVLMTLTMLLYAQPKIGDYKDIRCLSRNTLSVKLNNFFGVKFSFVASYDPKPPQNVEKLDTHLNTALSFSF